MLPTGTLTALSFVCIQTIFPFQLNYLVLKEYIGECNNLIAKRRKLCLALLRLNLWLVKNSRATFSINPEAKPRLIVTQSGTHTRFPALGAGYTCLFRILIGSLDYLLLL